MGPPQLFIVTGISEETSWLPNEGKRSSDIGIICPVIEAILPRQTDYFSHGAGAGQKRTRELTALVRLPEIITCTRSMGPMRAWNDLAERYHKAQMDSRKTTQPDSYNLLAWIIWIAGNSICKMNIWRGRMSNRFILFRDRGREADQESDGYCVAQPGRRS
jgi:hypothetical protein